MKVRSSVRRMCASRKIVKRRGVLRVICDADPVTSSARASDRFGDPTLTPDHTPGPALRRAPL